MEKEKPSLAQKKKNKSADYYSKDVYNYGSIYGINEHQKTQNSKEDDDSPVESWGWTNSTD